MKPDPSHQRHSGWNKADAGAIHAILELPVILKQSTTTVGAYDGPTASGRAQLSVVNGNSIMVVQTTATGVIQKKTNCRVYGEADSDACWYPFEPIYEQFSASKPPAQIDLTMTQERLKLLVGTTSVWPRDRVGANCKPTTRTIISHVRRASNVESPLHINCASPLELWLEDASDPIFMDTIASDLDELQPAVVLTVEKGEIPLLWIRPAVVSFDTIAKPFSQKSEELSEQRLAAFGVKADALARLNAFANEIADAYENC